MSYSSLPAGAVRSALRSMVYISYCNTDQSRQATGRGPGANVLKVEGADTRLPS